MILHEDRQLTGSSRSRRIVAGFVKLELRLAKNRLLITHEGVLRRRRRRAKAREVTRELLALAGYFRATETLHSNMNFNDGEDSSARGSSSLAESSLCHFCFFFRVLSRLCSPMDRGGILASEIDALARIGRHY